MDTDQEQTPPEADETTSDDATEGRPAQTVRVPNVSPNAKSGLDHTIIGSNALEGAGDQDGAGDPFDHPGDSMPQGDQDAALAWLNESEDSDTARARADQVWKVYATGDDAADAGLAESLRKAVYGDDGTKGDGDPSEASELAADNPALANTLLGTVTVPEGLAGEDLEAWVSGDAEEGDEADNPERWSAYQARRAAAGLPPTPPTEATTDGPAPADEHADKGDDNA